MGINSYSKLITKYIHSANAVVQPISLDMDAGIFTTSEIIPTYYNNVECEPAFNDFITDVSYENRLKTLPYELITNINNFYFIRLSNYTFCISTSPNGSAIKYTNTNNTSIDITKWHIEIFYNTTRFLQFDANWLEREFIIICHGFRGRAGWTNFIPLIINPINGERTLGTPQLITVDGRHLLYVTVCYETFTYNNLMGVVATYGGKLPNPNFYGNSLQQQGVAHNLCYNPRPLGIQIGSSFLNGFTVEVYEKVKQIDYYSTNIILPISNVYTLDLSQNNNFIIDINDTSLKTIEFTNIPAINNQIFTITLQLKYNKLAPLVYPNNIIWKDNKAPSLSVGKTYILMFNSFNGGINWQGSYVGEW